MPSFFTTAALAALTIIPAVSAHGYVKTVKAGGKSYAGGDPVWFYSQGSKPDSVGWYAENQDTGFVAPDAYGSPDIICHKGATPGNKVVEVAAGSEIEVVWSTWPESHKGPVLNYLARCHGDCTKVDKERLDFFAIQNEGLIRAADNYWASDKLIENGFTATVKIPENISGNFVLRHEIIGLHSAGQQNGAQNYPQCINLKVTGSGKTRPCDEGADCRKGPELFKASDKGILFNLYTTLSAYPIPGPSVYNGLKKRFAQVFKA